jgi:SulP family sulfate permease
LTKSASDGSAAGAAFETIVAGIVSGFLAIVLSIGFANLLLAGDMRIYTPVMVGMALFSTMVLNAVAAFTSPIRGGAATVQEVPIVVMAGAAAAIGGAMAGAEAHDTLVTIVVFLMATTMLTGLALLALGLFRLGGLIRFVPYPVVGGFLAGTGWLILQGGLTVIVGEPVTPDNISVFAEPTVLAKCALGALFIAALVLLRSRSDGSLVLPATILAAIVLYNLVAVAGDISPATLRSAGWLIPLPADGGLWPPLAPGDIAAVDWSKVAVGLVALPGLIVVTVMALLMNAASIELDRRKDVDLDRELRSLGVQNLVAGPTGGLPGYASVSLTFLADRLGGTGRPVGLVVAGLCAAAIVFGELVLGIVPSPLLGSLLVWIGGALMIEWLIGSYRRLAFREYAIIVLIFLFIVFAGFTWGILVGLAAAIVLFVVEYSRADIVRQFVRGNHRQSIFEGSAERLAALRRHGAAILIFRLQGYLFFGTADGLRKRILSEAAGTADRPQARFVLIDFGRVTGIDSSAVLTFARLLQAAAQSGFTVVIGGASADVRAALDRGAAGTNGGSQFRFDGDIEQALTWCENALLDAVAPASRGGGAHSVASVLENILKVEADAKDLAGYLERLEIGPGDSIIEQGSPSDDIYVFESGTAAVTIDAGGAPFHLASIGAGAIVGEIAFYTHKPRSASVVAAEPAVVWRFTRAALARLQAERPDLAVRFHEGLASTLADRLTSTNRLLEFLAE